MVEFNDNLNCYDRAMKRARDLGVTAAFEDRIGMLMCLAAADGMNGNTALDLERAVEDFDDANFIHDVVGIYRHMDCATGQLTDCFLPRCAV